MHIRTALRHLPGGRTRHVVATVIVAFCATLALAINTPVPASAAGPGAIESLSGVASVRDARPVMPSGKANHGQFSVRTTKSETLVAGYAIVHIWNCHTSMSSVDIWSWDYSTGGWQHRGTIQPQYYGGGCGSSYSGPGLTISLQDGHIYALAATDQSGGIRSSVNPVQGGTTYVGYWTIT